MSSTSSSPETALTTLTLNYWLSVFFSWIPALIFYFVERGKSTLIDEHNRRNLNFQILRTIAGLATVFVPIILGFIPYAGIILAPIVGFVLWAATIVLFVFAIIAAVKGPEAARAGQDYDYIFNIDMVKS